MSIIEGFGTRSSLHAVDDRLIGARMLGWLNEEAGGSNWWCCAVTQDGHAIEWDSTAVGNYSPDKAKKHYALRILSALANLEPDGGTWLVSWIDDCKKLQLLFKDRDGDIQACVDCDKSWLIIREWPMDAWQRQAEAALDVWRDWWRNMEVKRSQQYRLAAGEKPPSSH